ncbi:hypothetical protein M4D48_07910 [Alkalihalobacillus clausii]|uniref:hypothetical protein n=1 Tax=Shouchella clausii TaxID=79880 RepID=UPI000BA6B1A6|nr:hypothetical protein [Shouchella clausii]MCM3548499.1 hypothetical protein [Shouchella clausii]PAF13796.1 hypothetical protein CHH59_12185 [Shouchella clausii]
MEQKEMLELLLQKVTDLELGLKEQKEHNSAVAQDIKELKEGHIMIKQAVLETNQNVKNIETSLEHLSHQVSQLSEDQKSVREILGDHEVAIRTLRRKPV